MCLVRSGHVQPQDGLGCCIELSVIFGHPKFDGSSVHHNFPHSNCHVSDPFTTDQPPISYQLPFQEPKLKVPTIYKAYVRAKFQGIYPQNIALYGTNVPPFWDPEIPIDLRYP